MGKYLKMGETWQHGSQDRQVCVNVLLLDEMAKTMLGLIYSPLIIKIIQYIDISWQVWTRTPMFILPGNTVKIICKEKAPYRELQSSIG